MQFEPSLAGLHSKVTALGGVCGLALIAVRKLATSAQAKRVFANSIVRAWSSRVATNTNACHCSHSIPNLLFLPLYYISLCNCFTFCVAFRGALFLMILLMNDCALRVFSCSMFRAVLQTCVQSRTSAMLVVCRLRLQIESVDQSVESQSSTVLRTFW